MMMRRLPGWIAAAALAPCLALVCVTAESATTAKKKTAPKKAPAKAKAAPKSGKKAPVSAKKGKKSSKKSATTWRNRQLAPSAERYREIQTALAAKGYLKPEDATGRWDETSIAAMKKFQAEQNLVGGGKINSLSLIALGLGPKYDARAVPPPPAQPAAGASP